MNQYLLLVLSACFFVASAKAQQDTSRPQSITIISSYKPVLKNAAKINFSGSQLPNDTSKNLRTYSIPVRNQIYAYQPITLKPLAIENDSLVNTGSRFHGRAGFGNYRTPYLSAVGSFGDVEKMWFNVYADYISSRSNYDNQAYSDLQLRGSASKFFGNKELYAGAGLSRKQFYLYGYDHTAYQFSKSQISQQLNQVDFNVGLRNVNKTESGIGYHPHLKVTLFSLEGKLNENSFIFNAPFEKKLGEALTAKAEIGADMTHYETKNLEPFNYIAANNVYKICPSLYYKNDLLKINGGLNLFFNDGKFVPLPNIFGEMNFVKEKFILQGGWVSKIQKNTFGYLSGMNPYLLPLSDQVNTVESELYGGIKSSVGKHILFTAKASLFVYKNFQLFVNQFDSVEIGNKFAVSNEGSMGNFCLHGDMSYVIRDVFKLTAGINFNGYTGLDDNARAWNTIPVECTAKMRWNLRKKFVVRSDFYFFAGGKYLDAGNVTRSFNGAADWSVGLDYKMNNHFGAFFNLNNIFDKKYQRWHNYPVFGLNGLAGVTCTF